MSAYRFLKASIAAALARSSNSAALSKYSATVRTASSLFWGLQTWRLQPLVHLYGPLSLSGPPEQQFLRGAGRQSRRRLVESKNFFGQPFFKGFRVLDASTLLHMHAPFPQKGERKWCVLVTDRSRRPGAVTEYHLAGNQPALQVYFVPALELFQLWLTLRNLSGLLDPGFERFSRPAVYLRGNGYDSDA
jgi:hypothetical protein